ncbi:anaphase-promoting complex subunit 8 [Thamnocephalis sphaerospora]|uniref:Anaphase-promoting complex subunit 8 n=1 Tax=Thamnocephalis sphaerospora TaxID=78915 RepID=A0A4P9XGN4_9FUNG|nr:anaphase-promoting complex subunit 8 [Thamnocephalis sphaerospora]|eukprot:RKP04804.1 anaphase-promoting complex subunit 8 [Thamnocephalis sphaerospora]
MLRAAESLVGLPPSELSEKEEEMAVAEALERQQDDGPDAEADQYLLGRVYFDGKEYRRCAHVLARCTGQKAMFLRLYARYLAGEKELHEASIDVLGPADEANAKNQETDAIISELEPRFRAETLDGFNCYLYGVVLRKQRRKREALSALLRATSLYPCNWSAWLELADMIEAQEMANEVITQLPGHFVADLFQAYLAMELHLNVEAAQQQLVKLEAVFLHSRFIKSQRAIIAYNMRDFEAAEALFDDIRREDPYRLDQMDMFSNILFVMRNTPKLSFLAHDCTVIDKYRPETCLVLGNYYGLRQDHERAITYFRRALQLNKDCLPAWTLMGHEYMEMGNTHAAIEAYRRAVDIDNRDYRAWFGLGQTYEMLRMPHYALYYYERATTARPYDVRMWIAKAECYESLHSVQEAIKCYERALTCQTDEIETYSKLAGLYARNSRKEESAFYYRMIVEQASQDALDADYVAEARFELAKYEKSRRNYSQALHYTTQLLGMGNCPHDEAQALLREIQRLMRP